MRSRSDGIERLSHGPFLSFSRLVSPSPLTTTVSSTPAATPAGPRSSFLPASAQPCPVYRSHRPCSLQTGRDVVSSDRGARCRARLSAPTSRSLPRRLVFWPPLAGHERIIPSPPLPHLDSFVHALVSPSHANLRYGHTFWLLFLNGETRSRTLTRAPYGPQDHQPARRTMRCVSPLTDNNAVSFFAHAQPPHSLNEKTRCWMQTRLSMVRQTISQRAEGHDVFSRHEMAEGCCLRMQRCVVAPVIPPKALFPIVHLC